MSKVASRKPSRKEVRKMINREIRKDLEVKHANFIDQNYALLNPAVSTTRFFDLTAIAQGTSDSGRIGSSVNIRKLVGRLLFTAAPNAVDAQYSVRVIIGMARGAPLGQSDMPLWYQAADLDKMFIFHDDVHQIRANTHNGTNFAGWSVAKLKYSKKFNDLPVQYNGTVTAATQNQLFLYALDNTGGDVSMAGYLGTYYTDA